MIYAEIPYGSRLGNWMFIYAVAMSTGEPVSLCEVEESVSSLFDKYQDVFGGIRLRSGVPTGVSKYYEPHFNYTPIPVRKGEDLHIKGYFQSEKYFNESLVRKLFQITPARKKELLAKYGDWLERPGVTGISVRRGDYLKVGYYHPFVGKKYLKHAIDNFRASGVRDFIVCSDDQEWCKQFFAGKQFAGLNFKFIECESVLNQLYIHSLCKNNIISNSSFSWWGAWLNEHSSKRVIAPSQWFGFAFEGGSEAWGDIYFKGTEVLANGYSVGQWLVARYYWYLGRMKRWLVLQIKKWRGWCT